MTTHDLASLLLKQPNVEVRYYNEFNQLVVVSGVIFRAVAFIPLYIVSIYPDGKAEKDTITLENQPYVQLTFN